MATPQPGRGGIQYRERPEKSGHFIPVKGLVCSIRAIGLSDAQPGQTAQGLPQSPRMDIIEEVIIP